MNTIVDEATNY